MPFLLLNPQHQTNERLDQKIIKWTSKFKDNIRQRKGNKLEQAFTLSLDVAVSLSDPADEIFSSR